MSFDTKCHPAKASGGKEASGLAEAGSFAGSNFITRIADAAVIALVEAESVEQSSEVEPRQFKQVSAGTTVVIVACEVARTAVVHKVAGTCNEAARIAVIDDIAGTAIGEAAAIQLETVEQVPEGT